MTKEAPTRPAVKVNANLVRILTDMVESALKREKNKN